MKRHVIYKVIAVIVALIISACSLMSSFQKDSGFDSTREVLTIQETSIALQQTQVALSNAESVETEPPSQPTPEILPTETQAIIIAHTEEASEQPTAFEPETMPTFDEWLNSVNILLYDNMYERGVTRVIEDALDGLRLRSNTTNVKDAMGHFLSYMNSATQWDLIIIGAESRDNISGEYFDALNAQLDRGASAILEIWYIDSVTYGRIQPLMQRCGIAFQEDWQMDVDDNLNLYVVYLLDTEHPLFSDPNTISMLIPYGVMWYGDVGDFVKVKPDSEAQLLGGILQKDASKFGVIADCMDGRMIWQTFSTHNYKDQNMIDLWQNYIMRTLKARYNYLQE